MKLKKPELALLALAAAAVFFTAGYFAGRGSAGDVNITVTRTQAPEAGPAETGTTEGEERVNINTAPRWALMSLPGVGEVLADRIVAYRTENGPFLAAEELMNVQGIGESLFDAISGLITV